MSDLFYSEVQQSVQDEVTLRGLVNKRDRGTKEMDYMLSKIANCEITAFDTPERETAIAHLGGKDVRSGQYLPGPVGGFLDRNSKRIPPFIKLL